MKIEKRPSQSSVTDKRMCSTSFGPPWLMISIQNYSISH